jgi:hypothetical protein
LIASLFSAQRRKEAKVAKKTVQAECTRSFREKMSFSACLFCALGPFASWRESFLPVGAVVPLAAIERCVPAVPHFRQWPKIGTIHPITF